MTTLNEQAKKLIIEDKDIDSYFASRDNDEHTKIKAPKTFSADIMDYFNEDVHGGISLPFSKFDEVFRIRGHEVTIVSGYSGHGKSAWLNYVILKMLGEHKCLIGSFEMQPRATLGRMVQQDTGTGEPTELAVDEVLEKINDNLFLYDAEGETSPEKVLSVIYYAKEKLGVEVFVIDSLTKVGINSDDYNKQKAFVNKLCVCARDLGIHIFLVAHSRKTLNEHGQPSKFDVMGSSDITNLADNVLTVFRNKKKEENMSKEDTDKEEESKKFDCFVNISKQRHGTGWEGTKGFYFCNKTFRYGERQFGLGTNY